MAQSNKTSSKPKVCVIGAGIAGLTSAHYLQDAGVEFTVLEATRHVGGTWRYDPRVGTDENGLPLFTSMYDKLRTNLPKQAMELNGFPVPNDMPSFPKRELYYDYLISYTKHFDLGKHIQFLHLVTSVRKNGKLWTVKHKHVVTHEEFEEQYDFVFVCTGHYSKAHYPKIKGDDKFNGTIMHSHDYRTRDRYKDKRVVLVGAGPSAMDIGLDIVEIAKTVYHSHHSVVEFRTPFPENFIRVPDIAEFTEDKVVFTDGSSLEVDEVLYCTGFEYNYPFLDETSGLNLSNKHVTPLYKYLVNINEPTMFMFGLVVRACIVASIDAQARYATAYVQGNFTLPSKEEMMKEWQKRADAIQARRRPMSDIHLLAEKEDQYYEDIARESGTARVPPVLFKIRVLDTQAKLTNLYTYRNYVYTVVDEENFTRQYVDNNSSGCVP